MMNTPPPLREFGVIHRHMQLPENPGFRGAARLSGLYASR